MPRLCDRCECEIPDYARVVNVSIEDYPGGVVGQQRTRSVCGDCGDRILRAAFDDDELLAAPSIELQSIDTRRETALMAATQTLDAAATADELLLVADRFLLWLIEGDRA